MNNMTNVRNLIGDPSSNYFVFWVWMNETKLTNWPIWRYQAYRDGSQKYRGFMGVHCSAINSFLKCSHVHVFCVCDGAAKWVEKSIHCPGFLICPHFQSGLGSRIVYKGIGTMRTNGELRNVATLNYFLYQFHCTFLRTMWLTNYGLNLKNAWAKKSHLGHIQILCQPSWSYLERNETSHAVGTRCRDGNNNEHDCSILIIFSSAR